MSQPFDTFGEVLRASADPQIVQALYDHIIKKHKGFNIMTYRELKFEHKAAGEFVRSEAKAQAWYLKCMTSGNAEGAAEALNHPCANEEAIYSKEQALAAGLAIELVDQMEATRGPIDE